MTPRPKKQKTPFLMIPLPLFEAPDLSWTAKATWAWLANGARRQKTGAVTIGSQLLAEKLHVSKPTILRALDDLVRAGLVEIVETEALRRTYRPLSTPKKPEIQPAATPSTELETASEDDGEDVESLLSKIDFGARKAGAL
jgi:DNA-binding transcriptional MocR family regulator